MKEIFKTRPDLKKYDNPLNWVGFLLSEEDKVLRLIEQVDYLMEKDFDKGYKLLWKADKLYAKLGYLKEIEIKFNDIIEKYFDLMKKDSDSYSMNL